MSTVVELKVANFKKIEALAVRPNATGLVPVEGQNAAGKSSVLDAIAATLGGNKLAPEKPVRSGAKKAEVEIRVGDWRIVRKWTAKSSSIELYDEAGNKIGKPQTILDSLVGPISWDPSVFLGATPREQAAMLRDIAGINTDELDERRKTAYENRAETNRDLKRVQAQLEALSEPGDDVPEDEISVSDLAQELSHAQDVSRERTRLQARSESLQAELQRLIQENNRIKEAYAKAKGELEGVNAELKTLPESNTQAIEQRMAQAEHANRRVRQAAEWRKLHARRKELAAEADQYTIEIEKADEEREKLLASVDLPVKGLSYTEDGVFLDGVPLSQASQAERLKVAIGLATAAPNEIKVLLIKEGSMFDGANMKLVGELAEKYGFQVWVERVMDRKGNGPSILIVDGQVAEDDLSQAPKEPEKSAARKPEPEPEPEPEECGDDGENPDSDLDDLDDLLDDAEDWLDEEAERE